MKPLFSSTEWPVIAVYDLEADFWVDITLVCHVDEFGTRVHFRNVSDYLDWLFANFKGTHVFAHAGGHYDHRFLVAEAMRRGWDFKINTSGGTMVIVKINDGKRDLLFGDSYRLMPDALAKIGKTVGLAKLDVNPNLLSSQPFQEVLDYCYRDCDVVMRGLQLMKQKLTNVGADFAFTLASIATRYIRRSVFIDWENHFVTRDPNTGKYVVHPKVELWDEDCARAYHGGRCEMYRRGIIKGRRIFWYDIISSYPSSMREDLPLYWEGYRVFPSDWSVDNPKHINSYLSHCGITECEIFIPTDKFITVLPVKDPITNRLHFPNGPLRGAWTNIELQEAVKQGGRITRITGQQRFTSEPWLRKFVDTFYKLRQDCKNSSDEFGAYTFKILLNSSYGKSMETIIRSTYCTAKDREIMQSEGATIHKTNVAGLWQAISKERGPFRHSALGAYITAYSRLKLFRKANEMHEKGANIYYCDTDSLILDMPIEETGSKLGDWEFVGELKELELILPKVYRAVFTDDKIVYKCKGCPIVRKWEDPDMPQKRWEAFKNLSHDESKENIEILGKDGITGFKSDVEYGNLQPRRLEASCKTCKKTGLVKGIECPVCHGAGKHHKPLVRGLRSSDKKREWTGNESMPLTMNPGPIPVKRKRSKVNHEIR